MRLDIFECNHGRFLHHVSEVTCQREFSCLALAERGLDEKNFASHGSPCQSGNDTRISIALIDVTVEWRIAQETCCLGWGDVGCFQHVLVSQLESHFAQGFVELFLQLAYTAFSGILFDDLLDGSFRELDLWSIFLETGILQFSRNQMTLGNLYLLLCDVTTYFNEFHTVEQWTWDRTQVVGCGYEENLRQIIVNIQIVIMESLVLFRVENFQQSRRRITIKVGL